MIQCVAVEQCSTPHAEQAEAYRLCREGKFICTRSEQVGRHKVHVPYMYPNMANIAIII